MWNIVFKSDNYAKGGFIIFFETKLLAVKLTKQFNKDKHKFMRNKSGDFIDWIIENYHMDSWDKIPDEFISMDSEELKERFSKIFIISYADINKFKLSESYTTFDGGVQVSRSGTLLIKSNEEKIVMDHYYDGKNDVYNGVANLKVI